MKNLLRALLATLCLIVFTSANEEEQYLKLLDKVMLELDAIKKELALTRQEAKHKNHELQSLREKIQNVDAKQDVTLEKHLKQTNYFYTFKSELLGHREEVLDLAVLPNGELASSGRETTIRVWNMQTKQTRLILKGHTDDINKLLVLPDGLLASGSSDNTIRIWDTQMPSQRNWMLTLKGHADSVYSLVSLGKNNQPHLLASGSRDTTIKIWNTRNGQEIRTMRGHTEPVFSLAILADGLLASASYDSTIRVWNPNTGEHLLTLNGHRQEITSGLVVLPNGHLVSGSIDKTIKIWEIDTKTIKSRLVSSWNVASGVFGLLLLPNGFLASSHTDGSIHIWNAETAVRKLTLRNDNANRSVNGMALLPSGDFASAHESNKITIWSN